MSRKGARNGAEGGGGGGGVQRDEAYEQNRRSTLVETRQQCPHTSMQSSNRGTADTSAKH